MWTVPTFERKGSLLDDAKIVLENYATGKVLPVELYTSEDNGFEYGTYVCVVENEFQIRTNTSYAWCILESIPKNLHPGLKYTLNNQIIKTKLKTIMELFYADFKQ